MTRSPIEKLVTPGPTARMVPAASRPRIAGRPSGMDWARKPWRTKKIEGIEAGRGNLDQHLACARDRIGHILKLELINISVGLKAGCFHERLPQSKRARTYS